MIGRVIFKPGKLYVHSRRRGYVEEGRVMEFDEIRCLGLYKAKPAGKRRISVKWIGIPRKVFYYAFWGDVEADAERVRREVKLP